METSTDPPPDRATGAVDPPYHPAAALFPLMDVDGPEFGELVDDSASTGSSNPSSSTTAGSSTAATGIAPASTQASSRAW